MNNLLKCIKYFVRKINANKIGAFSAQTAFFIFLSLIPLIVLFFSLAQGLGATTDHLASAANKFTPDAISSFFETYIDEILTPEKKSLTIISSFVLLWSASRGIFSIIGGLNSVYEIKEERNYLSLRLMAMLYTITFLVMLIIALVLFVFGSAICDILYSLFPNIRSLVYLFSSLRFIIGFLILTLFFSLLYKSLPSKPLRFTEQIPGALITSAGWVSFSLIFSVFIENFSNYSNLYGSLTAIIVLLLWLYNCMYIMFAGAQVNRIVTLKANKH